MSEARAREIMTVYLSDVVGNGQIDLIDNFTAPTFLDHTQTELKGPQALRAHVETFRSNINSPISKNGQSEPILANPMPILANPMPILCHY